MISGLKQYVSMNGSTGMDGAQDRWVLQFERNLRKFLRRWLLSLQNIADFDSSWASTWTTISVYKVSSASERREWTDTSYNTIHRKKINSESGNTEYWILEQELREAEQSLSLEILKTWLGKALSCWTCSEHVVKLETSRGSFHPA